MNNINFIWIKNKAKEELARELLDKISDIFESYIQEWVYWNEEDIYNNVTDLIRKEYLYESDYINNNWKN